MLGAKAAPAAKTSPSLLEAIPGSGMVPGPTGPARLRGRSRGHGHHLRFLAGLDVFPGAAVLSGGLSAIDQLGSHFLSSSCGKLHGGGHRCDRLVCFGLHISSGNTYCGD